MLLKTNEKQLVKIAVEGQVAPAKVWLNEVGADSIARNLPGVGGITYNVLVGDSAFGWAADHIEPAVSSILGPDKPREKPNTAYNFLACVGNEAIVMTGDAKGKVGVVTGHHGGAEHVMIDFPLNVLEKLSINDRFQIRSFGQGMELVDFPDVQVRSLDPALLKKMNCGEHKGKVCVPVAAVVPGKLMGSGLGALENFTGDYDIMTSDRALVKKHKLEHLRLGDIIAITDIDGVVGWCYREGSIMIGVVIHGDSFAPGHGPGVTTIMASRASNIEPVIDSKANIGRLLGIGRFRH